MRVRLAGTLALVPFITVTLKKPRFPMPEIQELCQDRD